MSQIPGPDASRADRERPGRERSALPTRAARLGPAQNIPFGADAAGFQLSVTAADNGGYMRGGADQR